MLLVVNPVSVLEGLDESFADLYQNLEFHIVLLVFFFGLDIVLGVVISDG